MIVTRDPAASSHTRISARSFPETDLKTESIVNAEVFELDYVRYLDKVKKEPLSLKEGFKYEMINRGVEGRDPGGALSPQAR